MMSRRVSTLSSDSAGYYPAAASGFVVMCKHRHRSGVVFLSASPQTRQVLSGVVEDHRVVSGCLCSQVSSCWKMSEHDSINARLPVVVVGGQRPFRPSSLEKSVAASSF